MSRTQKNLPTIREIFLWGCNLGKVLCVCKAQGERGKARMTEAEFAGRVIAMQDTLYRVSTTILP